MSWTESGLKIHRALVASNLAAARVAGMKLRAALDPPRAAKGTFPFPGHRSCAEWEELPSGQIAHREPSNSERKAEARRGSAALKKAIERAAA